MTTIDLSSIGSRPRAVHVRLDAAGMPPNAQPSQLSKHLAYVIAECRRWDRTLLDLVVATTPTGITPDPAIAKQISEERTLLRELERTLAARAARLAGP